MRIETAHGPKPTTKPAVVLSTLRRLGVTVAVMAVSLAGSVWGGWAALNTGADMHSRLLGSVVASGVFLLPVAGIFVADRYAQWQLKAIENSWDRYHRDQGARGIAG